jgi:hypothetical protein
MITPALRALVATASVTFIGLAGTWAVGRGWISYPVFVLTMAVCAPAVLFVAGRI